MGTAGRFVFVVQDVDRVDILGGVVLLVGVLQLECQVGTKSVDLCWTRRGARGGAGRLCMTVGLELELWLEVVSVGSGCCRGGWLDVGDMCKVFVAVEVEKDSLFREEAVLEAIIDHVDELVDTTGDVELNRAQNGRLELLGKDLVQCNGLFALAFERFKVGEVDATGEFALEDLLVVKGEPTGVGLKVGKDLTSGGEVEDIGVFGARGSRWWHKLHNFALDKGHDWTSGCVVTRRTAMAPMRRLGSSGEQLH